MTHPQDPVMPEGAIRCEVPWHAADGYPMDGPEGATSAEVEYFDADGNVVMRTYLEVDTTEPRHRD